MAAAENFGIILRKWGKRVRTRQTTRQYSTKNQYIFPAVTLLVEAPVFLPLNFFPSEPRFDVSVRKTFPVRGKIRRKTRSSETRDSDASPAWVWRPLHCCRPPPSSPVTLPAHACPCVREGVALFKYMSTPEWKKLESKSLTPFVGET